MIGVYRLVNIEVTPAIEDGTLPFILLDVIEREGIVTWRELKKLVSVQASYTRIKRSLFKLIKDGYIIELPCRVLMTPEVYKRLIVNNEKHIIDTIKAKLAGLRKCGSPILSPVGNVRITISRKTGYVLVEVNQR